MLNQQQIKRKSKFLSLILRHKPEKIGLKLDTQGWADISELLSKLSENGPAWTMEDLEQIVREDNKQRYAFSQDRTKIRANQGHSIQIELGYTPQSPPEFLYHGTATRFIESIQKTGLEKRNRHHVHLSTNLETASQVGNRHGKLVVLTIRASEMQENGYDFFVSDNGVWLTDHIPVAYIDFPG